MRITCLSAPFSIVSPALCRFLSPKPFPLAQRRKPHFVPTLRTCVVFRKHVQSVLGLSGASSGEQVTRLASHFVGKVLVRRLPILCKTTSIVLLSGCSFCFSAPPREHVTSGGCCCYRLLYLLFFASWSFPFSIILNVPSSLVYYTASVECTVPLLSWKISSSFFGLRVFGFQACSPNRKRKCDVP